MTYAPILRYSNALQTNGLTAETHIGAASTGGLIPYALARDGESFKFEVHKGDRCSFDGKSVDRAELRFLKTYPRLTKIVHSQQINVLPGNLSRASWCVLAQWHNTPDAGEISPSPALAYELDKQDRLVIITRGSADPHLTQNVGLTVRYTSPKPITRGKPISINSEMVFDWAGAGSLKVTLDGVTAVNASNILMGFNDQMGVYFKAGIYRASSREVLSVVHSDIRIS